MRIKDIAELTKVSVATVSRVINDDPNVSSETREKIKKVIEETGYVPNFLGRNLRVAKTQKILLIIPTIENPFYTEILAAIEESAEKSGYNILIGITNNKHELEQKYMEMLITKQVDGAIVLLSNYDKDALSNWAENFPLVQCCEYTPGARITNVSIDNKLAAYDAVSYLISKGHRKIGAIGGQLYFASESDRIVGYKKALKEHNIPYKKEYFRVKSYTMEGGQEGARELMKLSNPPTAIFAFGDTIAIGVAKYLNDIGKPAGKNVAVIGVDDIPLCEIFNPSISSVRQPRRKLGAKAYELLMERIDNNTQIIKNVILEHELILRQSSECKVKEV